MTRSPLTSARVRPIRSMRSPTTITSAYIPITCAPMIGKTTLGLVPVLDNHDAGQGHDPDHHREARERGDERRQHSRAAQDLAKRRGGHIVGLALRVPMRAAIRWGSGRTDATSTSPTAMKPAAASQGQTSASRIQVLAREERAEDGRARMAPKTAPKRTKEIPRARRRRRVHVSGRRARKQRGGARCADANEAHEHCGGKVEARCRPRRAHRRPHPAAKPVTRTGIRPKRSMARPGGQGEEGAGPEHDRRAEADEAFDADDEDDRKRRDRGGELQHRGVGSERGREQDGVPPDRGLRLRHRALRSTPSGRPARRRARGGERTRRRARPRRDGRRRSCGDPGRAGPGNQREPSISSPVGRRFVSGSPGRCGCVGTRFQSRTEPSRPSSASTRWTIVALASAGPCPESCRSDVKGTPLTRAPR